MERTCMENDELPGCCGISVIHALPIDEDWSVDLNGLPVVTRSQREHRAAIERKKLYVNCIIASLAGGDENQLKIVAPWLVSRGFVEVTRFTSQSTGNEIRVYCWTAKEAKKRRRN